MFADKRFFLIFVLLTALCISFACAGDDDDDNDSGGPSDDDDNDDTDTPEDDIPAPFDLTFAIVVPQGAPESVGFSASDCKDLLSRALGIDVPVVASLNETDADVVLAVGVEEINQDVFTGAEQSALGEEAFHIRAVPQGQRIFYAIAGGDARGLQFGLYELLEQFGFRFFHPEQTYSPQRATIALPDDLDTAQSPDYQRRGFHIHTMHPTPHSEFLQRSDPQYLEFAKNLIRWHVRNKQNYMQWELLRTVDFDSEVDHFIAIADYAHQWGMDIGIVVSFVFAQQKAWKIVPRMREECKDEMEANIDQLMQVPWDHINLEMGSSEFTKVDDRIQMKWMNNTVAYLRENYPGTEASVKIHCSTGQKAPHYGNINFNFLPQFADPDMGVYPHTVQYYDLQGPAPAYGNDNFEFVYDWMVKRVGERKVYYYPETAYWCSLDIDVPLFLPVYLFNRWKDIVLLADKGIDGHVTFTSGHEWGYWLSDWTVARYTWDAGQDWTEGIGSFTEIFGDAGDAMKEAIRRLTLIQEDMLIGNNLASYLGGQDTWDELGYLMGTQTHPKPITFLELYKMKSAQLAGFENTVVENLNQMQESFLDLMNAVDEAKADVPAPAMKWYEEMADCFRVDYYRSRHAYLLYAGATARRHEELGDNDIGEQTALELFDQAKAVTEEFLDLMKKREAHYRYPLFLSTGRQRSLTSYDFRYLYQASTGYWYKRYEKQAINKNFNIFLDNLIDPFWFMF